ncbi:MAG: hypothetical protein GY801_37715 [bacterium]|nr:hypothetical protein [bacterium]
MGCIKFLLIPLLIGGTLLATVATFAKWGAADIEHPQGIDLRQESTKYRRGAFFAYYGRSHYGGGLRGGK